MQSPKKSSRSIFVYPAYALALIIPVIAIIIAYFATQAYCNANESQISTPRICSGLRQAETKMQPE
ncbi:MAG: hypothetical protein MK052_02135 [Alphaproteobacteria bacterium]|nr:hypothetical protein [Alphaproteobacteria bacterium]